MNNFLKRILRDAPQTQTVAFGQEGERTLKNLRDDVRAFCARWLDAPSAHPSMNETTCERRAVLAFPEDRYAFCVAMLACWTRGISIALPPNARPQTIEHIQDVTQATWLFHDGTYDGGIDVGPHLSATDDGAQIDVHSKEDASHAIRLHTWGASDVIATLYSSGTTRGVPDAAPKSAQQLIGEATMLAETLFPPHARVLSTVQPGHIYGLLYSVLAPLCREGAFGRRSPFFPESIAQSVQNYRANVLVSVPAHLATFTQIAPENLATVVRLISSTAPLPQDLANQIHQRFQLDVTEVFGSSETGGIALRNVPTTAHWSPLPQVSLHADEDGRLWVDSPYINASEPRPFRTEDRVRFVGRRFVHEGRWDRVVKIGGRRLSLDDMEAHLRTLSGIDDVALWTETTEGLHHHRLHLAAVGSSHDKTSILKHLGERFERSTLPRHIVFLDALPREANGKLQTTRLRALIAKNKSDDANVASVPPPAHNERASTVKNNPSTKNDARYPFHVDLDYPRFNGHFHGYPLMAAAVQLHDLLAPAAQQFLGAGHVQQIVRIKFQREIKPGDALEIRLKGTPDALDFSIWRNQDCCTSGRLVWESAS